MWTILQKFIHEMCILFKKFECASWIGRKVFNDDFMQTHNDYASKMFIEANIDFNIMMLLSINSWVAYPKKYFWKTLWDSAASTGTIFTVVAMLCYPVYGAIGIYRNLDRLHHPEVLKRFGILYEDQRHNDVHQAMFTIYGIYRRISMVMIFVYLESVPYF
jgi:hypothetical protein